MMRNTLRTGFFALLFALATLAFGQSFSTDGSGTITIAGSRNQVARVRTEPNGRRIRIIVWTTTDKRYDLVGDNAKSGDGYRVQIDDGLGEVGVTGYANVYTYDWTSLKSITASGRFRGGTFDLSFQAERGGGSNPGWGGGSGRMGSLNISRVNYKIDRAEYQTTGNSIRLILYTDNGKRFDLVGRRSRNNNYDNLTFDDGLGEERLDGTGRVSYNREEVSSANGRGNFRGGSFNFDVRWNGGGGNGGGWNKPENSTDWSGKLRFDNNSRAVTRVEYNPDGNKFRLVIWTTEGKRYDVLGTRSDSSGNRDKLYVNDGLGKERMSGTGTVQFSNNSRNRVSSITVSGSYRGGSYTITLNPR